MALGIEVRDNGGVYVCLSISLCGLSSGIWCRIAQNSLREREDYWSNSVEVVVWISIKIKIIIAVQTGVCVGRYCGGSNLVERSSRLRRLGSD